LTDEQLERAELRAVWVGLEDAPIMFVNQTIGQVDDHGDIIVTFGQATPPVLFGTPEEQREQVKSIAFIQVHPVTRVTFSTSRAEEVVRVLQQTIENQKRIAALRSQEGQGQ
jgi:hypothetical protein